MPVHLYHQFAPDAPAPAAGEPLNHAPGFGYDAREGLSVSFVRNAPNGYASRELPAGRPDVTVRIAQGAIGL